MFGFDESTILRPERRERGARGGIAGEEDRAEGGVARHARDGA
jgi:hypothetical protein